jgi:serine/threonine protein kinase
MISEDGTIKIIDFGLAKTFGTPEKKHTTYLITKYYRPPEMFFGAKYYGPLVDIWSAGCILGELLIRSPLFPGTSDIDILAK